MIFRVYLIVFSFTTVQGVRECSSNESCEACPELITEFRSGNGYTCCKPAKQLNQECLFGESCTDCPSLIDDFRNGRITRSEVEAKACEKNGSVKDGNCGGFKSLSSIVGGEDAKPGVYPFVALIGKKEKVKRSYGVRTINDWRCGGTIINRWYVLTAAHCYFSTDTTDKIKIHRNYNSYTGSPNDIALVKLERPVELNNGVNFVCLPLGQPEEFKALRIKNYDEDLIGVKAHAVGWGFIVASNHTLQDDGKSKYAYHLMQKVELPIMDNTECERTYNNEVRITENHMCSGGENGKDSCKGDSGGPIVINYVVPSTKSLATDRESSVWMQVGVISFGPKNCGTGKPSGNTRLSKYIDWIKENLD